MSYFFIDFKHIALDVNKHLDLISGTIVTSSESLLIYTKVLINIFYLKSKPKNKNVIYCNVLVLDMMAEFVFFF